MFANVIISENLNFFLKSTIFRVNGSFHAAPSAAETKTLCSPRYRGQIECFPILFHLNNLTCPSQERFLAASRSIAYRNKYCATLTYPMLSGRNARKRGCDKNSPRRLSDILNKKTIGSYRWSIMYGIYVHEADLLRKVDSSTRGTRYSSSSRRISEDFTALQATRRFSVLPRGTVKFTRPYPIIIIIF